MLFELKNSLQSFGCRYVFEKDYFTYYFYSEFDSQRQHYTVTYKYEIMDEGTLAYFFDSVEIYDDDDVTTKASLRKSNGILLFSENVISTQAGTLFVR